MPVAPTPEVALTPTLAIAKALADATRLRMLLALEPGELCLCQFIELFQLSPSTLSKQANVLHAAGLIERRKDGRWVFYRLAGRGAPPRVRPALRWARAALADDATIATDRERLAAIRCQDPRELTACYNPS
jgi:ArsR family transcriptional regulator, arsenate/arsenite/antimonite-responsive transcriptional repressor